MKNCLLFLVAAIALAAPLAAQAPAPGRGGQVVFVQELENELGIEYYTSFLVYITGLPEPFKVDPKQGPFVSLGLPAGEYRVERIGLFIEHTQEVFQYYTEIPVFSITVRQGERTPFPYLFSTKILKGPSPGSYYPRFGTREMSPAEIAAVGSQVDAAQRSSDEAAAKEAAAVRAAAMLDDPAVASQPAGELVFVNELENTTRDAYYTAWLVALEGRSAPFKIDPVGRFVRLRLPAGTYKVASVGLYLNSTNSLQRTWDVVTPFLVEVRPGERTVFPWLLITKILDAGGGAVRPIMDLRALSPEEAAAAGSSLDREVASGSPAGGTARSVAELTPRLGRMVATVVPFGPAAPPLPSAPVPLEARTFRAFAAQQGIRAPERYEGSPGEYLFPMLAVTDRARRVVTLGGYLPRTGAVSIDWGDGKTTYYEGGRIVADTLRHTYAGAQTVRLVRVFWTPPGGELREAHRYADLSATPWTPAAAGPPIRARTDGGTTLVVTDEIVEIVTPDVDRSILDTSLAGAPAYRLVNDLFGTTFDFVFLAPIRHVGDLPPGTSTWYSNDARGIGLVVFGNPEVLPIRLITRYYSLESLSAWALISHEMFHAWGNFVVDSADGGHWGYSTANGLLGGMDPATLVDLGDGRYRARSFRTNHNPANAFSNLELYLMGLAGPGEVPPIRVFESPTWVSDDGTNLVFRATGSRVVRVQDIITKEGPRLPAYPQAQRDFRAITVLITDTELAPIELEPYRASLHYFGLKQDLALSADMRNFRAMTRGRGSLRVDGLLDAFRRSQD